MSLNNPANLAPVVAHLLVDDGVFPNNSKCPVLAYPGALNLPPQDPAAAFETLFRTNKWGGSWRNGVYRFHHYHSTAHEVLGVYGGQADVLLGGETGIVLSIQSGDVLVIPAGVAHKNLGSSPNFRVVGAYPLGTSPDMNYGKTGERPRTDETIGRISLPEMDPVYGPRGPLKVHWPRP